MTKHSKKFLRLAALVLTLAMVFSTAVQAVPALSEGVPEETTTLQVQEAAPEAPLEEAEEATAAAAEDVTEAEETAVEAAATDVTADANEKEPVPPEERKFWQHFGTLAYRWMPGKDKWYDGYFYNIKNAWQRIFGFNKAYDALSFLAGCSYDTIRVQFNYGGREWMVQLWKGGYFHSLCTGGEIGIYNRKLGSSGSHYSSAMQKDWIGMQFSIYAGEIGMSRLFTRPMEDTFWATGYKPYILDNLKQKPLTLCTMDATLRFKDAAMASAFAQALAAKNFAEVGEPLRLTKALNTERYTINGDTVHLLWRDLTEK